MFVYNQVYIYVDTSVLDLNMKIFFFAFSKKCSPPQKNDQTLLKVLFNVIVKCLLKGLGWIGIEHHRAGTEFSG